MPKPRCVLLVAYPGAQLLDVTGPCAVFAGANRQLGHPAYELVVASAAGGPVHTSSGVVLYSVALERVRPRQVHTLLVVGGEEAPLRAAARDPVLRRFVLRAALSCPRYGSVCSGAFLLAEFGLLDGKRVTTHWDGAERLARAFPKLSVDADALYIEDGRVWTSAGVTTGIDMALALVERDCGAPVATAVAQRLVLYARRPGYQSQWSPVLAAQSQADAPYAELVDWIREHLAERLDVEQLAERAGQSLRTFHRRFSSALGQSPAHFVERLRLDRVRELLHHPLSLKEIAVQSGFGDAVRMSRAFERRFGVKPSLFRASALANRRHDAVSAPSAVRAAEAAAL